MTQAQQPKIQMQVPDDLQAGVYANLTAVWHTAYEFTLDFAVMQPVLVDDGGDPLLPARIVSRVKIPTALMFQLMQALNTNMTLYENVFGPIKEPGKTDGGEPPLGMPFG